MIEKSIFDMLIYDYSSIIVPYGVMHRDYL
jgi:CDP-glycerol glycerophosphotransferase (TagB/SpsB family)